MILLLILSDAVSQTHFVKVEKEEWINWLADSRSVHIVDMNHDGRDDIFITNGPKSGFQDLLFLQTSQGNFERAKVPFDSIHDPSVGACIADIDNNGYRDIYITNWYGREDKLLKHYADGQFETISMGKRSFGESADFSDINNDGWLDLYTGNSEGNMRNILYLNTCKGEMTEMLTSILSLEETPSRGVTWIDYNNDGLPDLFICNENKAANALYKNLGQGVFIKIEKAGDLFMQDAGTMSASWGDVNNDGFPDLFLANSGYFKEESNQLFINNGDGTFQQQKGPWDADLGCSYSSSFADYDNDGDLDLVVTNGYCHGDIVNFLYLNDGNGHFVKDTLSQIDLKTECSYGVAWGDLDNNGFQDLVIATCQNINSSALLPNQIWLNEGNNNHWIKAKLTGVLSNRDAVGAKIRIRAQINNRPVWQTRWIQAQSGYCSQNSFVVHFGLLDAQIVDSVIVHWPSGVVQIMIDQPVNTILEIQEDPPMVGKKTDITPKNSPEKYNTYWVRISDDGIVDDGSLKGCQNCTFLLKRREDIPILPNEYKKF
ncbi:MAG TPA: CRTAC1 family protein [Saprospiraceae bacterium]|nr:CRTAC1 family protein [Saprospiraceae bacterium]